ncbi:MAG: NAD(+)/NADH kinase [Bdellovibrionales bacterium]|nr:NAD(+)/NADH kinase [Bdellovibrionales bacterium]
MRLTKITPFKKKIKNVLIVFRTGSPDAQNLTEETSKWLEQRKISTLTHAHTNNVSSPSYLNKKVLRKIDFILVLGGDGTYLEAVRMARDTQIPLLGVNMGSLGFLTVIRVEDLFSTLEMVLKGRLQQRHRSLIHAQLIHKKKPKDTFYALNDVVIERGPLSQLLNLAVHIDQELSSNIKSDGLIISTPTGSSAYNLAAGGPILHPLVEAFVITPICPHSLTHRPLVVSDTHELKINIVDKKQKAFLTVDGRRALTMGFEDELKLIRANHFHLILRRPSDNFFNLLKEKLRFGERA